jgi:leucyl-tRNA synthetase
MLMIEGKQMHKSRGNFVTMKNATEQYGADATRCALLMGAEGMDDPDYRAENARDIRNKLESFHSFAKHIIKYAGNAEIGHPEKWLMSTLQHRISEVTENLEQMKTRTALEIALFEIWNDFRWYTRRKGETETKTLKEALKIWLKLLAPFAPHLCEELWSQMHPREFISTADWPKLNEEQIDTAAEEQEDLLKGVIEDTLNVLKATKLVPRRICYYTASSWKWRAYIKILEKSMQGEVRMNEIMKELAADEELKKHIKEIAKFAADKIKDIGGLPDKRKHSILRTKIIEEKTAIENAAGFLSERFKAEIKVYGEEDSDRYDPMKKAAVSMPRRPAIYVE